MRAQVVLQWQLEAQARRMLEDPRAERLHAEWGEVSLEAAELINGARPAGGRIVAVGTTALRLLETAALRGDSWQRPARPLEQVA